MARWIEHDAEWYEQRMVHCSCCGRLIAKHLLLAKIAGTERTFCSEACAELFETYVLAVRGEGFRPSPDARDQYEARMTH